MPYLIKDDELLGKYNEILQKVRNNVKKEFDSESVYNEKYLENRTKWKNFHNNEILKQSSQCIYLSAILNDSVYRTGKNYYP